MGKQLDHLCVGADRGVMRYRSVFMARDWLHVSQLDWEDCWPHPALRIMSKRSAPIVRHIIVSELNPADWPLLAGQIAARSGALAEVTVHDLTDSEELSSRLGGLGFAELDRERVLNRHTTVFDLTQSLESLFEKFNADTRRKVRLAEKQGVMFLDRAELDGELRRRFGDAYNAMAVERQLAGINEAQLNRMFASGHSRLAAACTPDRGSATFVMTFEADEIGFFYHGASDGPAAPALGRAVHWGLIKQLKVEGFGWYDFGGLPTLDPENGITRFKLGFGGEVINLGREYRRSGPGVRFARRAIRLVRRIS